MTTHIVIPARFSSSRLPGKPLKDIAGKTMIERVVRQAEKSAIDSIIVATDDQRIVAAVEDFGGKAMLTREDHPSGTDRLAEVAETMDWHDDDIVINVQGDEPLIPPQTIRFIASLAAETEAPISTLACKISKPEDVFNPNIVKVVMDDTGKALYFSRAAIPWDRDQFAQTDGPSPSSFSHYRHLGIYAYRVKTLKAIPQLPPCPLEQAESLEQLRPMYHGLGIQVGILDEAPPHGVDTPEDLARVTSILQKH